MENLQYIMEVLERSKGYTQTLQLLSQGVKRIEWSHLHGSANAVYLSLLHKELSRFVLCVSPNEEEAGYLYNDLLQLSTNQPHTPKVFFFPSLYAKGVRHGVLDTASEILRTELLQQLYQHTDESVIIVTYPEALLQPVVSYTPFQERQIQLEVGGYVDRPLLRNQLCELGFQEVDYVYEPGQFAVRGSLVDIYSYAYEWPVRVDFFGDEVETIRFFEVTSQLSREKVQQVSIYPSFGLEDRNGGTSLLGLLPNNSVTYIPDYPALEPTCRSIWETPPIPSSVNRFQTLADMQQALLEPACVLDALLASPVIAQLVPNAEAALWAKVNCNQEPEPLFHKNFELLRTNIESLHKKGFVSVVMSNQQSQIERLLAILQTTPEQPAPFVPILPTLHAGFIDNDVALSCYTDHTIFERFHRYQLKSDRIRNNTSTITLKEISKLEYGDYVVHANHGIGMFAGLFTVEQNGQKKECVRINYKGGDFIYVSIHALHQISKYRSKDDEVQPQLSKLGSGAWDKLKERTKKKVKDIARDLIKIYAKRLTEKGFAFSPDTYLQQELESSFKYEDTPDQLEATTRIKEDMEKPIPMDRLVCGDVGFGKTEIAIRAAFKAVADSKQVAVLVPTTLLAYQHYQTFKRRLHDFPCRVEYLSRAKTPKQRKQILEELQQGSIDVIIGTHTLASKTVTFKDLGLVIIDEEQKFGVAVKERLRQYRTQIDTLTLTATPIPRTLQFSLMGARDLSNILTPPPNRIPIRTEVAELNEDFLREVINYELARGGQVYFVHNRVFNLPDIAQHIHNAVPRAKLAVAHGQLPPQQLEQILLDFANHEFDILLSTSIVENGIDIPNANTIIINDAHHFGLSDLHQLRGRVGRGSQQAFCYLLAPPYNMLSVDAKRRLKAISTFSELGSGIHIAMQDLDIRGAGNLLGQEQSGFIADLGYETYKQILEEAVDELREEEIGPSHTNNSTSTQPSNKPTNYVRDTTIDTDLEAYLPPDYVPGDDERLTLYRELDRIKDKNNLHRFVQKLTDRFGAMPTPVKLLLELLELRMLAQYCGAEKIVLKKQKLRLQLVADHQSGYYKSNLFMRLLNRSGQIPWTVTFEEKKGNRYIVIHNVDTPRSATNALEALSAPQ